VSLLKTLANKLSKTTFGQKSMAQKDMQSIFKKKPDMRVYVGLGLLIVSCFISVPAFAFLTYLSVKSSKPIIIAVGGPVIFIIVHIVFGFGVYLAGKNYAMEALQSATKRFLQKHT